jgi:hypothetical protein
MKITFHASNFSTIDQNDILLEAHIVLNFNPGETDPCGVCCGIKVIGFLI